MTRDQIPQHRATMRVADQIALARATHSRKDLETAIRMSDEIVARAVRRLRSALR